MAYTQTDPPGGSTGPGAEFEIYDCLVGPARQRHESDWLQFANWSSVEFICCEHAFTFISPANDNASFHCLGLRAQIQSVQLVGLPSSIAEIIHICI